MREAKLQRPVEEYLFEPAEERRARALPERVNFDQNQPPLGLVEKSYDLLFADGQFGTLEHKPNIQDTARHGQLSSELLLEPAEDAGLQSLLEGREVRVQLVFVVGGNGSEGSLMHKQPELQRVGD